MEAIKLHKQMAMGKTYPTSCEGSGKDPSPKAPKPTGNASKFPDRTTSQASMPAKRATSGG